MQQYSFKKIRAENVNLYKDAIIFCEEIIFENVFYKMSAIVSGHIV